MRVILASIAVVLIVSGCSHSTAFTPFTKLDAEQELAASNLQTTSIFDGTYRKAIISSIYLNNVKPQIYNKRETFLIALYLRDHELLQLPNIADIEANYKLRLDGKAPISISTIDADNPLRKLMPINNEWNNFYVVEFSKSEKETFLLTLENEMYDSASLKYEKRDL